MEKSQRGLKRKRDVDHPRITYHASKKTFDRLFKEDSLSEMKEVVRRKLGITTSTSIGLAQVRDGITIDLEDDDDFDAFHAAAHSVPLINVRVTLGPEQSERVAPLLIPTKKGKRRKQATSHSEIHDMDKSESTEPREVLAVEEGIDMSNSNQNQQVELILGNRGIGDAQEYVLESPRKKKRRKKRKDLLGDNDNPDQTHSNNVECLAPDLGRTQPSGDLPSVSVQPSIPLANDNTQSKNAKRRKRHKSDASRPQVATPAHPADSETQMIKPAKHINTQENQFADRLAGAISATGEANAKPPARTAARQGRSKDKKNEAGSRETIDDNPNGKSNYPDVSPGTVVSSRRKASKDTSIEQPESALEDTNDERRQKGKRKPRTSTVDEREAANADVKAALSRVLAAKRGASSADPPSIQEPKDSKNNTRKRKPKLKNQNTSHNITDEQDMNNQPAAIDSGVYDIIRRQSCTMPELAAVQTVQTSQARYNHSSVSPDISRPDTVTKLSSVGSSSEISIGSDGHRDSPFDDINYGNDTRGLHMTLLTSRGSYAGIDLEAIIRGPKVSVTVADISSADTSDDEQELILEEDEDQKHHTSRPKRTRLIDSSDEGEPSDISESLKSADPGDLNPTLVSDSRMNIFHEHRVPFHVVDQLGESQELENSGDAAFMDPLAEDTAVFKLADDVVTSDPLVHNDQDGIGLPTHNDTSSTEVVTECDAPEPQPPAKITEPVVTRNIGTLPPSRNESIDKPKHAGVVRRMKGRGGKVGPATPDTIQSTQGSQDAIARRTRTATRSMLLKEMITSTPQLPNSLANKDRRSGPSIHESVSVPPITTEDTIHGPGVVSSEPALHAERPRTPPIDTWATLKVSSPPDPDSTVMVDELLSSSPGVSSESNGSTILATSNLDDGNIQMSKKDPLFILTESQPPFPYSQWNDTAPENPISNDSDDVDEVEATVQSQWQPKSTGILNSYRRLTDIASQRSLFSTPTLQPANFPVTRNNLMDIYGRSGDEVDSESDTDSDTDSDAQEQSHIPIERRAGRKRKLRL